MLIIALLLTDHLPKYTQEKIELIKCTSTMWYTLNLHLLIQTSAYLVGHSSTKKMYFATQKLSLIIFIRTAFA